MVPGHAYSTVSTRLAHSNLLPAVRNYVALHTITACAQDSRPDAVEHLTNYRARNQSLEVNDGESQRQLLRSIIATARCSAAGQLHSVNSPELSLATANGDRTPPTGSLSSIRAGGQPCLTATQLASVIRVSKNHGRDTRPRHLEHELELRIAHSHSDNDPSSDCV